MRGTDVLQQVMFSYVSLERRVPKNHPLRPIRAMINQALQEMSEDFDRMYSTIGRPSIPPERLMRASLLQMLYSVRSEQLLMEQLDYNLLFRWFVGLETDDPVWVPSTFSKYRDRFLSGEASRRFLAQIVGQARQEGLLSDEHFSVDGTLIEAWASMKSVRPKDGSGDDRPPEGRNPTVAFWGEKRSNQTHASESPRPQNPVVEGRRFLPNLFPQGRHTSPQPSPHQLLPSALPDAPGHELPVAGPRLPHSTAEAGKHLLHALTFEDVPSQEDSVPRPRVAFELLHHVHDPTRRGFKWM
ncbi:MAG: IS5 family transposase [Deltaproteobacteria bacterium]|nr:IS5 family transposase [Deltaproteobacteria bacterium]